MEAKELESSDASLDEQVMVDEEVEKLQKALEALPEDYQEVIRLRILLDLTTSEVATHFNRSEGAVRILLHRAIEALRKQVSG